MPDAPIRVYIAAPKAEAPRARAVAATLRASGIAVTSRWHDTIADGAVDPVDDEDAWSVLAENLSDLDAARVVVALTRDGVGRETYVEIGRAIELDKDLVWSAERGGLALSRLNAVVVPSDLEAISLVEWKAERARGRA